jgi:outer membrane protein insertion porin family
LKGDKYRTAFRTKVYLSRDVPQLLQSQNNGYFSTVSKVSSGFFNASPTATAYTNASNGSPFFTLDGNTVAIQRTGATVSFVRPLNGGDPFKKAPWSLVVGVNAQEARPMNFGGQSMPYAVATNTFSGGNTQVQNVICIAYNCQNGATTNPLLGVRVAATMTTLNDPRNPTSGNFLSLGTEQFVSVGQNSPTFNRMRASGTHFIPVNWLKLYKGCRPKPGQKKDCNQALAFQLSLGSNVGQLPVYEAFCLGGNNSVRGYYDCDLGVGKSFGEATIEYRFPIFSIISGEVFIDGGTTFNTQANVTGNPGGILKKAGSGSSPGVGLIVTTPVGPLRLEAATQNFTSNWRFNLGVGWKF